MSYIEIFLLGLATALIGYLIVNWLTIGRDRRREFNALIDPVRRDLIVRKIPSFIDIKLIREKLPRRRRSGFDRVVEAYKKSRDEYNRNRKSDGMGGFVDGDRSAISHTADDLLKYLKPR